MTHVTENGQLEILCMTKFGVLNCSSYNELFNIATSKWIR